MKNAVMVSLVLLLALSFAGSVSAHVTVQPKEAPANSYQVFTLRVPSEKKGAATTQVKVEIPASVEVSRFEPKPDWTYELEKNADGKITAVTWKSKGTGLGDTDFGQFNFQGKVAQDAKELVWKAHQTYSDGSVVDWTGPADADKPASVTKVTAATGEEDHGHGAVSGQDSTPEEGKDSGRDPLTLSLAAAGFVAGLAGLLAALFRRGKRV